MLRHNDLFMRISQTLSNSKHNLDHCLWMNVLKMQRIVCNKRLNDVSTTSGVMRRMRAVQCPYSLLVKIKVAKSNY